MPNDEAKIASDDIKSWAVTFDYCKYFTYVCMYACAYLLSKSSQIQKNIVFGCMPMWMLFL